MFKKLFKYKFLRFLLVGSTAAGIDMVISTFIVFTFAIYPPIESTIAKIISGGIAIIFSFFFSRLWTFKSKDPQAKKQLTKFVMLNIFNTLLQAGLIALTVLGLKIGFNLKDATFVFFGEFTDIISIVQVIVSALLILIFAVWNYFAYQKFIFHK